MSEIVTQIESKLPPGKKLPDGIRKLIELQDQWNECIVSNFEMSSADLVNWFDGDRDMGNQFVHFAQEADDSSYAMWFYPELQKVEAPIVFLSGEATDFGVIANNLTDFMSLLAVGFDEIGYELSSLSSDEVFVTSEEVDLEKLWKFRNWLKCEFDIEPAIDPAQLVLFAKASHPNLKDIIIAWQKEKYG